MVHGFFSSWFTYLWGILKDIGIAVTLLWHLQSVRKLKIAIYYEKHTRGSSKLYYIHRIQIKLVITITNWLIEMHNYCDCMVSLTVCKGPWSQFEATGQWSKNWFGSYEILFMMLIPLKDFRKVICSCSLSVPIGRMGIERLTCFLVAERNNLLG